jgi:hypothetical protein
MTTTTFLADSAQQSVNWNDPARWSGGVVPNSPTVDVIIPEITVNGSGSPYTSFITVYDTYTVSSLSLAHNYLVLNGANLTVAHNLDISNFGEIDLLGAVSLSAGSIDNNGFDIQGSGTITTTGLFLNETTVFGSGLNLTAGSLSNAGALIAPGGTFTVTVTPGGFTNLSGSTLSGGTYRAGGFGNSELDLNVGSVIDTDAADIQLDFGGTIYSYDDVSHAYVSLASSLHSIAGSGTLFLGHQTYNWSNLTVDGSLTVSTATLNTSQLTVDNGGKVFGIGTIGGPIVNNGTIIAGPIDNVAVNSTDHLFISGVISGAGTLEIASARITTDRGRITYTSVPLELGAAASSNVVFGDGRGTLKLDDVAEFTGKIQPAAAGGDIILLRGIAFDQVTSYNYSGDSHAGTLAIQTTGGETDLQFLGDFTTADFYLKAGPQPLSSDPASLQIAVQSGPAGGMVSIDDVQIAEGNSGAKLATFTVTRSGGTGAFDVNFVTSNGSATTADGDYNGTSGTLHFAAGANTQTISVTINGDLKIEPDETFFVNLSGAKNGAVISDNQGVGTIINDDHATANDFNGDGKSDILWRNDAGALATWDMNDGTLLSSNPLGSVPANWKVAGTGDFNGDGKADILWRNDTGPVAIWDMNDGNIIASNSLGSVPTNWHIAGVGDFNGDTKSDILWRNDSGVIATWDMNDGNLLSSNSLGSVPDNWHIAGTGDFNGDHKSDILWRNDAGALAIWDLNDGNLLASNSLGSVPDNWKIAGIGDFNGDGKSDILWRNDTGPVSIWDMNDGNILASNSLGSVPANWTVSGIGDYNGDHKSDILWRNDAGAVAIWDMNDGNLLSSNPLGSVPADWHIIA